MDSGDTFLIHQTIMPSQKLNRAGGIRTHDLYHPKVEGKVRLSLVFLGRRRFDKGFVMYTGRAIFPGNYEGGKSRDTLLIHLSFLLGVQKIASKNNASPHSMHTTPAIPSGIDMNPTNMLSHVYPVSETSSRANTCQSM
jgi:hypothetical protein